MTYVVGHRGASLVHRENTLEAFAAAVALGADWIELDVRRSRDDVLVVSHDAHLPDGAVIVEHDYVQLPEWLPTLAEALESCEGARVNIEIKNDPDDPDYDAERQISDAVVGLALAYRDRADLLVSSFDIDTLRRIQEVDASMPVGLLTYETMNVDMVIDHVASCAMVAINPWEPLVDRHFVERAHAAGLLVNTWTVNDADRMAALVAMGVDGIISDDVALARRVVDAAG